MSSFDSGAFLDTLLDRVDGAFNCPICQSGEWTLVDSTTTTSFDSGDVGAMHTVPMVCDNCGFVAEFAVGQD